jgi:hypothetical protein
MGYAGPIRTRTETAQQMFVLQEIITHSISIRHLISEIKRKTRRPLNIPHSLHPVLITIGEECCNGMIPMLCFENCGSPADGCGVTINFYCREAHNMGEETINVLINSYLN